MPLFSAAFEISSAPSSRSTFPNAGHRPRGRSSFLCPARVIVFSVEASRIGPSRFFGADDDQLDLVAGAVLIEVFRAIAAAAMLSSAEPLFFFSCSPLSRARAMTAPAKSMGEAYVTERSSGRLREKPASSVRQRERGAATMLGMSIAIGVVRKGQLVLEGDQEPLPEGQRFTVLIEDEQAGFHLTDEQLKLLREAQAEIRRGNFVTEEEMLKELDED